MFSAANGGAVPFNTQFFHDDYDDGPGFDDGDPYDGDGAGMPDAELGEQDLLAATQGKTRRVKPEFVNYARRAKRVDVRKLKENIWKGLDIVLSPKQDKDTMASLSWLLSLGSKLRAAHRMSTETHWRRRIRQKRGSSAPSSRVYKIRIPAKRWTKSVPASVSFVYCISPTSKGSSLSPRQTAK